MKKKIIQIFLACLLGFYSQNSFAELRDIPIVVIGGGPAGLSLGYELSELKQIPGKDFVILEKGKTVGTTWKSIPKNTRILSPWEMAFLMNEKGPYSDRDLVMAKDFAEYLSKISERHHLTVETGAVKTEVEVLEVTKIKGDNRLLIHTTQHDYRAKSVVAATGYFSNPKRVNFTGIEALRIPVIHWAKYESAEHLKKRVDDSQKRESINNLEQRKVLVIGKGLSSGQLLYELSQSKTDGRADFELSVSVRGPIKYDLDPDSSLYSTALEMGSWLEKWKVLKKLIDYNEPRMEGGRVKDLMESGRVTLYPDIERAIGNQTIRFKPLGNSTGQEKSFDLIVMATGYSPHLPYLDSLPDAEKIPTQIKSRVRGLYFLGFDQLSFDKKVNKASRLLRGIRQDAKLLADFLVKN